MSPKDLKGAYCGITIVRTTFQHCCSPPMAGSKLCTALDLGQHPAHPSGSHHEASRGQGGVKTYCLCEIVRGVEGPPEGGCGELARGKFICRRGTPNLYEAAGGTPPQPSFYLPLFWRCTAFPGPASCQQQYQATCQQDLLSSAWQVSGGRLLEQQWEIFWRWQKFRERDQGHRKT